MRRSPLLIILLLSSFFSALTAQNIPAYIPSDGLMGWWPFNGNANDESGNGNDGTVYNAILTNDRFGNNDNAYDFNGFDAKIEMSADSFLTTNFSVSVWVNRHDNNGFGCVIGKTEWLTANHEGFVITISESQILSSIKRDICSPGVWNTYIFDKNASFDNSWQHIVLTFNGNEWKFYINTVLVYSITIIEGSINCQGGQITLGSWWGADTQWFKGRIDDLGIWKRTLSEHEITEIYNGLSVDCDNDLSISPQSIEADLGSTATLTATSTQQNQTITWQSDLGQGFQTLNDYGQYSGTSTATLTIQDIQLANHQQPIRAISTFGDCVDTSDVVIIQVIDTCFNYATIYDTVTVQVFDTMLVTLTIYDTILTTVTDTLVINAMITGLNPPLNQNTIKVYPNPTSTHITIDYGNFSQMMGYQLRIVNTIGQVVFQTNITQSSDFLNLSTWGGTGIYFLHLIDPMGNTIDTRKIVLQ